MCRKLMKMFCNLTCRKAMILTFFGFLLFIFTAYFVFFNHGPPEAIMDANRRPGAARNFARRSEHMDELEKEINEEESKAIEYWDGFIKKNNFVSIGELYDHCDSNDRIMVGRTIMLPDVRWGGAKGVKARTFINTTIDSEVTGGKFFLEVKYNGNDLFKRNWELCTLDEDAGDERMIFCPINPGDYSFAKDRQIPLYLPKGRYETKGWMTDQNDDIIICGFSDFSL